MPNPTRKNTLFALLFIVIGLFMVAMAAGLVPVDESDINAPLWLLSLVGVIFMIAGVMIMLGRKNRYNDLLAALLTLAMGAIGAWVAVYSASGEISGGLFFLPSATNVMLGRILFGIGSLICFAIAAYALNRFFRRSD